MGLPGVHLNHAHTNDGKDPTPPELVQAVPQEVTTQNESTQGEFLDKERKDSILSSKRISLTRELSDLRKHVDDSMRRENDERFTLVEALGRRLEDERAQRGLKLQGQDDRIAEVESSQKQLDLEQKAQNAQIKDLTSRLDAECADRKQRQEEQNQVEISRRAREVTWEEEISSQKKFIEAESASREQLTQALSALIALSSERESTERHMQLEDLESRVELEMKNCADIIQDLRNTCVSNRQRIEELTGSHTQSHNPLDSLWDLQRQSRQDLMESGGLEGGERSELLATLRALVIESADRQSTEIERQLEMKSSEQNAKVDDLNAKIEEQLRAHAELAASHQQLMSAHQQLALLFRSLDDASKKFVSNIAQIEEANNDLNSTHA